MSWFNRFGLYNKADLDEIQNQSDAKLTVVQNLLSKEQNKNYTDHHTFNRLVNNNFLLEGKVARLCQEILKLEEDLALAKAQNTHIHHHYDKTIQP